MAYRSHNYGTTDSDKQLLIPVLDNEVQVGVPTGVNSQLGGDEGNIDLLEYWRILVRRRRTIFSIFIISVLTAVLLTYNTTPIYRSTVVLQIEREAGKVVNYDTVTPVEAGYDTREFYQTQYELLGSRSLARRVIDKLGIELSTAKVSEEDNSYIQEIRNKLASIYSKSPEEAPRAPDLESIFLSSLLVEPVRNSRLVKIHYDSPNPSQAAQIVNALAQEYISMSLERRFDAASHAKNFLEERIRQVKYSLEESEKKLNLYAKEREIINLEDKQEILMQKVREINKSLISAETDRIEAEAEYQQLMKTTGTGFSKVLDSPVIQSLKERKAKMQADYEEQGKVFKPGYPRMQQLEQQGVEIDKQLETEIASIRSAVKATYQTRVQREAKLRASLAEAKEQILTMQDKSTDYQTLKREVDTNRQLYDGLLQRIKEVGVVAGIGLNNISIVDQGEIPNHRYKPSLRRNLGIAIALGLVLGIMMAFLFEALDDTLKTSKDIEDAFSLPVLGIIPEMSSDEGDSSLKSMALATQYLPRSHVSESYRSLRTALMFSSSQGVPKILNFTSAGPGEGKTTTAVNIAVNFAQTGAKVLLIDADLRNPSLHKIFDMSNSMGLTNYLAGDLAPARISQPSQVTRLFVTTSGPIPPNPVELLAGPKMIDLLALAKERFDYVVMDGPPLLGLADAVVISKLAEGTVLIAQSGAAKKAHVAGAVKRLIGSRVKLLGVVLSKVSERSGGYGYGYGHGYSYRYHYSYGGGGKGRNATEEELV